MDDEEGHSEHVVLPVAAALVVYLLSHLSGGHGAWAQLLVVAIASILLVVSRRRDEVPYREAWVVGIATILVAAHALLVSLPPDAAKTARCARLFLSRRRGSRCRPSR